jgi:peptidoglycan hydrolase-like protein with peptidoglycan-binding domain
MLTMILKRVPGVLGIYGTKPIGGVPAGDYFPMSAALLHPDAASAYAAVETGTGKKLRVSDMFRSPEASLAAMQQKSGVQPPGYSAHNFGLAIDVATDACLKTFGMTKQQFDEMMASYGWYCHRKDHQRGSEDWHYNHFGVGAEAAPWLAACAQSVVTSAGVEAKMVSYYGKSFMPDTSELQVMLKKVKMYGGDIDGDFGPRSQQAVLAFERAWKLPMDGQPDARMMRTLATVASEQSIFS